jgi:hypothetical protein
MRNRKTAKDREIERLKEGLENLKIDLKQAQGNADAFKRKLDEQLKKVTSLVNVLISVLMPWAQFMGVLNLQAFIGDLSEALLPGSAKDIYPMSREIMADVYGEKGVILDSEEIGRDDLDAGPPTQLQVSVDVLRKYYKRFVLSET